MNTHPPLPVPLPAPLQMGEQEYYNSKDLLAYKPEFYYGCTSKPRNIITKKKIPKEQYTYATFEKLTKKWNPTEESCKKAQLLISKQWVDQFYFKLESSTAAVCGEKKKTVNNININTVIQQQPNLISSPVRSRGQGEQQFTTTPPPPQDDFHEIINSDKDQNQVSEEEYEEENGEKQDVENAPPILYLDDSEKFHDADGNVIEIETRGERHEDKIYFNAKDVSIGFGMLRLNDTLIDKDRGYTRGTDYKIMFNHSTVCAIKKCLFLTYKGLLKCIAVSRVRSQFFNENSKTIYRWLNIVSNEKQNGHENDSFTLNNVDNNTSGFIYVCTSNMFDGVKIGRTVNEKSLKSRYTMAYGNNLILYFKKVDNMHQAEKQIHDNFKKFNINGELFQKEQINLYIDYLNTEPFNVNQNDTNTSSHNFHTLEKIQENSIIQEEEEQEQQEIENAPPILYLNDSEKFHDAGGNVIEIETRGERQRNKIYFKVKDVSVGFGMPRLKNTILKKESCSFERGIHYITFKRESWDTISDSKNTNKPSKTTLYLTYKGLLRVLFVSRNKHVDKFQDWAEEKLFTIQMGTRDQKVKLGAEVLNTSPRTLKAIFDKHAATFPSIYLMSLGKVRELRETFGIPANKPDESTVYKFGFTDDLSRRVIELETEYSKLPGVAMTIGTFHIIDTKYTSEAENEVREMCAAFEVRVKKTTQGFNELIVLDDKQFANMKKMYRRIGDDFAGATLGLQKQIAELKDRIKDYENEIMRLKLEIEYKDNLHKKDIELKDRVIELKDTVIENWKLKHQLATTAFSSSPSPKSDRFETEFSMVRC